MVCRMMPKLWSCLLTVFTPVSKGESSILCPSGGAGPPPGDSPCNCGQDSRPDAEDRTVPGQGLEGGRWICPESPAVCRHQRGLEAGAGTQAAVASGDNSRDSLREGGRGDECGGNWRWLLAERGSRVETASCGRWLQGVSIQTSSLFLEPVSCFLRCSEKAMRINFHCFKDAVTWSHLR